MAAKVKKTQSASKQESAQESVQWGIVNNMDLSLMYPQTQTGATWASAMLHGLGIAQDDIAKHIAAAFGKVLQDETKVKAIVSKGDATHKTATRASRIASKRAILDKYNDDNATVIAQVAAQMTAAKAALALAQSALDDLRAKVIAELDVAWSLDVQLVDVDTTPKLYIPSDSLAGVKGKSKGKANGVGRSGPRGKRVYDFSPGNWTKNVTPKTEGLLPYTWTVNGTGPFTVTLACGDETWTDTQDNMSDAAKTVYWQYLGHCGADRPDAQHKIPLNLPSALGIGYTAG